MELIKFGQLSENQKNVLHVFQCLEKDANFENYPPPTIAMGRVLFNPFSRFLEDKGSHFQPKLVLESNYGTLGV